MSSFIFSSDARRYVGGLTLLTLLPASVLFAVGIYLEPLYGDLTRFGAYSEREFGWTKPQLIFPTPLYTRDRYTQYHDIVVLGDSFSWGWPEYQWQNYIVAATGLSVVTLDIKKTSWNDVLESRTFLATPPRVFIVSIVEREFPQRIKGGAACVFAEHSRSPKPLPPIKAIHVGNPQALARHIERNTRWNDVKLEFVWKYFWQNAQHRLKGVENTAVRRLNLTEGLRFSSANQRQMLVLGDDIQKTSTWKSMGLEEMRCRIEHIRWQVEANEKTRFVLMVAPDKLTAYAEFISDTGLRNLSLIGKLSDQHTGIMPRLDIALPAAIRSGEQDIYLPDDTHWGSSGHRMVADTLLDFLHVSSRAHVAD